MCENSILKLLVVCYLSSFVDAHLHLELDVQNDALDQALYEKVLDSEECSKHVGFLRNNALLLGLFLDAGLRTPRDLFAGNTVDLGNYHQCLGLHIPFDETNIEGKYCMIRVPFNQKLNFSRMSISKQYHFDPSTLLLNENVLAKLKENNLIRSKFPAAFRGSTNETRSSSGNPLQYSVFRLAVYIPKPCTTQKAISGLLFNLSSIGFEYEDDFCRLPNDKPWVPADYTAMKVLKICLQL